MHLPYTLIHQALVLICVTSYADVATLKLESERLSVEIPPGWQFAVPGPLTSPHVASDLNTDHPSQVIYAADRQLLKYQDAVDQMYHEEGRLDAFVLHRLITGLEMELMIPMDNVTSEISPTVDPRVSGLPRQQILNPWKGSTYAMTEDYNLEHRSGPDPVGEGNAQFSSHGLNRDFGNLIIAGPEQAGTNFRASLHMGVSEIGQYVEEEGRSWSKQSVDPLTGERVFVTGTGRFVKPRNSAELVTYHLERLRKGASDQLLKIENRRSVELMGKTFIGVTLVWQRGNQQVVQDQFHRKDGSKHYFIELTTLQPSERKRLLQLLESIAIKAATQSGNSAATLKQ